VAPLLAELLGPGVNLVDTSLAVARHTRNRLAAGPVPEAEQGQTPTLVLQSTGEPLQLQQAARRWLHPDAQAQALNLP